MSSLSAGRHILLLAANPYKGLALAELASDVAADEGLCYGGLTVAPHAARLLSPANIIVEELRDDFWLIVRAADSSAISRVEEYIAEARPARAWRAIVVTPVGYRDALSGLSAASRLRFAVIEVS